MTGIPNVTHQPEMRQLQRRRPSLVGLLVWWVGIAAAGGLAAAALVDVVYSRVVYLFVVMPVGRFVVSSRVGGKSLDNASDQVTD